MIDPAWDNCGTAVMEDNTVVIVYEFGPRSLKIAFCDSGLFVTLIGPGRVPMPAEFRNSPANIAKCLQWLHIGDGGVPGMVRPIPGLDPVLPDPPAPKSRLIVPRGSRSHNL